MTIHWIVLLASLVTIYASELESTKACIETCKCKPLSSSQAYSVTVLRVLNCNGPIILNSTVFEKLNPSQIVTLSFENSIIQQIQEDAFSKFNNLEDIVFRNCHMGSIDTKTFNKVQKVNFADCRFEDRPDFFSEKLEELHFGNCQLEEIPKLNNLLSLTFLNLSGNLIKDIDIETFAELFDLAELHLTDNEIFKLPSTLFINNRELNALYLDNNPLKEFYLNTSENLAVLSLRNCHLEKFDEKSTLRLSTVNELNLSHNKIKNLTHKALANMRNLASIDVSFNKIIHLDDNIFASNSKLGRIVLDGNYLKTLPNFYLENGERFTTNTFSCNYCGLLSISESVFKNMSLLRIYLSHNQLQTIENSFTKIPTLMYVDISYNQITQLTKKTFMNNNNLVRISLAGNPLRVLDPEVFTANEALSELNARNCSLSKLWSNTNVKLINLEKLLIGNNNLTTLTVADFEVMPSLEGIDLDHNPLIFNTDLCEVFESLERKLGKNFFVLESKPKETFGSVHNMEEDSNGFITSDWTYYMSDKCYVEGLDDYDDSDFDYSNDEDDDVDPEYETNETDQDASKTRLHDEVNSNFARASYILSITSVFVLSALVVLTVAVTLTLCILKRNNNMHRANIPRLKIPLWTTSSGQKKHSGSVYRPLSEEISCPTTPKFNRYEFTATPTVHSANP